MAGVAHYSNRGAGIKYGPPLDENQKRKSQFSDSCRNFSNGGCSMVLGKAPVKDLKRKHFATRFASF